MEELDKFKKQGYNLDLDELFKHGIKSITVYHIDDIKGIKFYYTAEDLKFGAIGFGYSRWLLNSLDEFTKRVNSGEKFTEVYISLKPRQD